MVCFGGRGVFFAAQEVGIEVIQCRREDVDVCRLSRLPQFAETRDFICLAAGADPTVAFWLPRCGQLDSIGKPGAQACWQAGVTAQGVQVAVGGFHAAFHDDDTVGLVGKFGKGMRGKENSGALCAQFIEDAVEIGP